MKRLILILTITLLILSLSACNKETKNLRKENNLYSLELTEEEQKILDLAGYNDNLSIYEFNVTENYKSIST